MERILSVCQMRSADKFTIENLGISEDELIYRAGVAISDVIKENFFGGRVLICVGKGNNGKDGLIVAKILSKTHGFSVSVFDTEESDIEIFNKQYDIVLDCVFGIGLNREINGHYKEIIEKINNLGAFVIACDIPSGINGDTGAVMGVAVKANMTVAIQEYKTGHFLGDGIDFCGKVICKDIGISVWDDNIIKRIDLRDAKKLFQSRQRNVHKGNFGKACVIGGSKKFSGSVILSANALSCLKSGVGYSYLGVPKTLFNSYVGKNPECILFPLEDDDISIVLDKKQLDEIMDCDTISIGMGMTVSSGVYNTICYLLNEYTGTLIIDADGLNSLSKYGLQVLKTKKCKVVLTPHIGEFSRLANKNKERLSKNIISYAVDFAKEYDVILALKSAVSIITDGKEIYLNTTGCSGMAKAGSGDVLTGFMTGVLSRSESIIEGVLSSMYVFGKAGEIAQEKATEFTITASDIIDNLSDAINIL